MCVCLSVCLNNAQKFPELLRLTLCRKKIKIVKEHTIKSQKCFCRKHIFLFIKPTTEYHCIFGAERTEAVDLKNCICIQ